jgi:hypothetical protein
MILDIRYHDKSPEQIQRVRLTTVYCGPDANVGPELVIHFYRMAPQRNIPLADILAFTVTND